MTTISTFKTSHLKFNLDEEFEETTIDDRHVKSLVTRDENNVLTQVQSDLKTGALISVVKRRVEGNDLLVVSNL